MAPSRIRTFVLAGIASLFLALAFLGGRTAPLEAADCGGPGDPLCKENEACAGFLWWKQCTSTYDYWSQSR